jgi:hypothetical protein
MRHAGAPLSRLRQCLAVVAQPHGFAGVPDRLSRPLRGFAMARSTGAGDRTPDDREATIVTGEQAIQRLLAEQSQWPDARLVCRR